MPPGSQLYPFEHANMSAALEGILKEVPIHMVARWQMLLARRGETPQGRLNDLAEHSRNTLVEGNAKIELSGTISTIIDRAVLVLCADLETIAPHWPTSSLAANAGAYLERKLLFLVAKAGSEKPDLADLSPIVQRLVSETIWAWRHQAITLIKRLLKNQKELADTFGDHVSKAPIDISFGKGDPHSIHGGTAILSFPHDFQLVYKPRRPFNELCLGSLLDWSNQQLGRTVARVPKISAADTYFWQESISRTPISSPKDAASKAGALLEFCKLLGITDLHQDNVWWSGENWAVLDGETLLAALPRYPRDRRPFANGSLNAAYAISSFATGLVPDVQAVIGREEMPRYGFAPLFQMPLSEKEQSRLLSAFTDGAKQAQVVLRSKRKELLHLVDTELNAGQIMPRVLLRDTTWYMSAFENSLSNDAIENASTRFLWIDCACLSLSGDASAVDLHQTAQETLSLLHGRVPDFTTLPDGVEEGIEFNGKLRFTNALRVLENGGAKTAFAYLPSLTEPPSDSASPSTILLSEALRIGERVCKLTEALYDSASAKPIPDLEPEDFNLTEGYLGTAICLAMLAETTEHPDKQKLFLDTAERLANETLDALDRGLELLTHGLGGKPGAAWAVHYLSKYLKRADLKNIAASMFEDISNVRPFPDHFGTETGAAGTLFCLHDYSRDDSNKDVTHVTNDLTSYVQARIREQGYPSVSHDPLTSSLGDHLALAKVQGNIPASLIRPGEPENVPEVVGRKFFSRWEGLSQFDANEPSQKTKNMAVQEALEVIKRSRATGYRYDTRAIDISLKRGEAGFIMALLGLAGKTALRLGDLNINRSV